MMLVCVHEHIHPSGCLRSIERTEQFVHFGSIFPSSQIVCDEMLSTRKLYSAIGLETNLDKILFSISVFLTVMLLGGLCWFFRKKKESHKLELAISSGDEKRSSKESSKYPTITIVQKSRSDTNDDTSLADSTLSSMWDTQSQKYDNSFFKETQLKREIENCLSRSRDYENAIRLNKDSDSFISDAGESTIERVEEQSPARKTLQRNYHIYSKSMMEPSESRDDEEYGGAQSV